MGSYKETGFDEMLKESEKKFLKQKYSSLGLSKTRSEKRLRLLSSAVMLPPVNIP